MRLPVAVVEVGVLDGIAAMDHHIVADVDTHMAGSRRIIGSLEEDQIAGSHICG